jgi:hypothetical protein
LGFEHPQRLAHRGDRDVEHFGDFRLLQLLAAHDTTGDDLFAQEFGDLVLLGLDGRDGPDLVGDFSTQRIRNGHRDGDSRPQICVRPRNFIALSFNVAMCLRWS